MPYRFKERVTSLAANLVVSHRTCSDIAKISKCELYYEMIDNIFEIIDEVVQEERALMRCGHPRASLVLKQNLEKECRGCVMEAQMRQELTGMARVEIKC